MKIRLFVVFLLSSIFTFGQDLPEKDKLWVFFMAGQSNMAGRGIIEAEDTITNPRIWSIDKEMNWVLAKEPLHFYEPNLVGLDCGLSFGKELIKSIPADVSIAIIPCAIGGSSVEQWLNDEHYRGVNLYSNFKEKAAFSKQFGLVKGIIWHQGESNANDEKIPVFEEHLLALFSNFRNTIGIENLPIVMGEIGSFSQPEAKAARWKKINEILHQISQKQEYMEIVNTGDLNHKGDFTHFNSEGQRIMGKRYAEKMVRFVKTP